MGLEVLLSHLPGRNDRRPKSFDPVHDSKHHLCQMPVKTRHSFAQTPQRKAFISIMFLASKISNHGFSENTQTVKEIIITALEKY
jgi:hypothetical protein